MRRLLVVAVVGLPLLPLVGILAALVWWADAWVVSGLASVTLLAWLALWLVIVYGPGSWRSAAWGAVLAGGAYWLLALGPWFGDNVGPTLLTTRLLATLNAKYKFPPAGAPSLSFFLDVRSGDVITSENTFVTSSVTGTITGSGLVTATPSRYLVTTIPSRLPPPSGSPFTLAGQWSFVWLAAIAGGLFSAWLAGRTQAHPTGDKESAP